jgi:hypothetical protein
MIRGSISLHQGIKMKKTKSTIYKTIATIFFSSVLSACGGGGSEDTAPKNQSGTGNTGSGTTTTVQTMTVSPSTATLSIDELTSGSFDITASNPSGNITVSNDYVGDSTVTTTSNGNVITVTIVSPDINIDATPSFKVTLNDGTTTKIVNVTATIINSSGNALANTLDSIASNITSGTLHAETESVMNIYNKIALLTGSYSKAASTRLTSDFEAIKNSSYNNINDSGVNAQTITERVGDYRSGALTELDIVAFTNELSSFLIDSTKTLTNIINKSAEQTEKLTNIPEFKYNHSALGLSIYTGNDLMGEWVDDEWVFNDNFSIVSSAISNPCSAQ